MALVMDPAGDEIQALKRIINWRGKRVLEVGCGDGRLTRRYADRALHVTAIDPFEGSITRAKENTPDDLKSRVEFRHIGFDDSAAQSLIKSAHIVKTG